MLFPIIIIFTVTHTHNIVDKIEIYLYDLYVFFQSTSRTSVNIIAMNFHLFNIFLLLSHSFFLFLVAYKFMSRSTAYTFNLIYSLLFDFVHSAHPQNDIEISARLISQQTVF
jgi:hypothetical protein